MECWLKIVMLILTQSSETALLVQSHSANEPSAFCVFVVALLLNRNIMIKFLGDWVWYDDDGEPQLDGGGVIKQPQYTIVEECKIYFRCLIK